jgi:hypothetical protein
MHVESFSSDLLNLILHVKIMKYYCKFSNVELEIGGVWSATLCDELQDNTLLDKVEENTCRIQAPKNEHFDFQACGTCC